MPGLLGLISCRKESETEHSGPLIIPVDDVPLGRRAVFTHGDLPVEVRRSADSIVARSLLCTHLGCQVRWVEAEQVYQCPCHEGVFAASGEVISGPPPSALRELPVTIEGGQIRVAL